MTTFFGFGIAPSMFPESCTLVRSPVSVEELRVVLAGASICLNPSHRLTIDALRTRFGIEVPIPERAPVVTLRSGDTLLVMGVSGLPRLEGRHEYTAEEVENAKFAFSAFHVL